MTKSGKRGFVAPVIVGMTFFTISADKTIVATALPAMAESFGVYPVDLGITVVAYIISIGAFLPITGWLADRFGAQAMFAAAILVFGVGSISCSFSNSVFELTMSRVLQGLGASMIFPVGRMIALHDIPKERYIRAMVIVSLFPALGFVMGPSIGGFITTFASWRWIFFVNIPVAVVCLFLIWFFVENFKNEEKRPLDWGGFVLTALAVSFIMYGVEGIGRGGSNFWFAVALLALGLVFVYLSVRHSKRQTHPLIDLSLLNLLTLRKCVVTGTIFRISIGGLPFLLPLLFQVVFGMTAFEAGLILIALGAGVFTVRLFVEKFLKTFGFRSCLLGNTLVFMVCLVLCTFVRETTPTPLIAALLYVIGMNQGFQFTTLTTMAYTEVPQERMGRATPFVQMFQQASQGLGVALAACLLHIGLGLRDTQVLAQSDFTIALLFLAGMNVFVFLSFFRMPPTVGGEISGHSPKSSG